MISNEQIFYEDMERIVDPETYNGADGAFCLIGQMQNELDLWGTWELAEAYNIDVSFVDGIFLHVAGNKYMNDLKGALEYVRFLLGLMEFEGAR